MTETMKKAAHFEALANEKLENVAEAALKPQVVFEMASSAASAGFHSVIVPLNRPVDLRRTATAARTIELLKAEGFNVRWLPQAERMTVKDGQGKPKRGDLPLPDRVYYVLEVVWGDFPTWSEGARDG
jgi:hypothetical protein